MTIAEKARDFVTVKHSHLFRPNKAKQPIIEHLAEVAGLVEMAGGTDVQIAAAWLHDTVEDTKTTLDMIRQEFGVEIARLVDGLTDPPEFAAMPLAQRKPLQAERLAKKSDEIKLIKLCDQISNVRSVLHDPPSEWDAAKSLAYVTGAQKLAEICAGLSPMLDGLFDEVFDEACRKYKALLRQA